MSNITTVCMIDVKQKKEKKTLEHQHQHQHQHRQQQQQHDNSSSNNNNKQMSAWGQGDKKDHQRGNNKGGGRSSAEILTPSSDPAADKDLLLRQFTSITNNSQDQEGGRSWDNEHKKGIGGNGHGLIDEHKKNMGDRSIGGGGSTSITRSDGQAISMFSKSRS